VSSHTNGAEQLWSFTSMADASGFHAISPVSKSTSVLSLPTATTADDTKAQEWTWNSSKIPMQWSIGIAH
jgi:hypothetical protein